MIIMDAPHRFDLEELSCVNTEVKVFNRELNKIMKWYNHVKVIDMSTKRDHYTQHGLHMHKTGKEWITKKTADIINKLFANLKSAHVSLEWKGIDQEDRIKYNAETVKETTPLEINSSTPAVTELTQDETGNEPKQSTGMREKCGNQGEENEVDKRNTNQESRDIKSTQNNADRNSEERLNQIEDEASSDNNNVKNNEDGVPLQTLNTTPIDETSNDNNNVKNNEDGVLLQTLNTTPIDIAAYPSSESLDGKTSEEPTNLAFPSYPQRNCPAKKNPDFLWA